MSVGERITELRKSQNISQGDLAKCMGVSRQAVSKWENGLSSPDTVNLIRLAEVLETDVEYLATGRNTVLRRPPVVIKSVEYVDRVIEKPVIQYVDRPIEKPVQVIEYIDRPVIKEVPIIKKVTRTRYKRNIPEYIIVAVFSLLLGLLIGTTL